MSIQWIGDFKAPSGYGRACRADLRALLKAECRVHVKVHKHDRTEMDLSNDGFWADKAESILAPLKAHPDIVVWQETPEFYRPDPTGADVARIEWETSRIVDYDHSNNPMYNWVAQLNRMTEIWPASKFVADVLVESGVTTPCHVIPHPIDLDLFSPGPRVLIGGDRPVNKGKFTALSVFQLTARKDPWGLLLGWSRSRCGKDPDCSLLIKTYGADFNGAQPILAEIAGFRKSLNIPNLKPNVFPITYLVPEEKMPEMYRAADVFVCTSKGEGFGLPVQESAACGLPCIYTDATAHAEFAVGYPVKVVREPVTGMPHIPWYSATQDWWRADVLDLADKFDRAYDDWKSGRLQELGKQAREKVAALHNDGVVGAALRARLVALGYDPLAEVVS